MQKPAAGAVHLPLERAAGQRCGGVVANQQLRLDVLARAISERARVTGGGRVPKRAVTEQHDDRGDKLADLLRGQRVALGLERTVVHQPVVDAGPVLEQPPLKA